MCGKGKYILGRRTPRKYERVFIEFALDFEGDVVSTRSAIQHLGGAATDSCIGRRCSRTDAFDWISQILVVRINRRVLEIASSCMCTGKLSCHAGRCVRREARIGAEI